MAARSCAVLLAVSLFLTGCDAFAPSSPQQPSFTVTNNLENRVTVLTDTSGGSTSSGAVHATQAANFSVTGVVRVTPPTVKGKATTASYLSYNGKGGDRVYVGYKIPGPAFGGGIDVFNAASPKNLTSLNSLKSKNLDVQEVVDDPDVGAEYVAGAVATKSKGDSPAVIAKLDFPGNSGNKFTVTSKRLSANVAKSVVNAPSGDSRHDLYVVTDGNSLYRFTSDLGDKVRQTASGAAFSSLTTTQNRVIMLTKSGQLWTTGVSSPSAPVKSSLTLDGSGIDPLGIARISASTHDGSGTTYVYAALNKGGFRVLNSTVDTELFRRTKGHYTSVSASPNGRYLYASRKNGTVEVYAYNGSESPKWGPDPIATIKTTTYGSVPPGMQANQVLAVGDYLYVANSTGGLLVLQVNDGSSSGPPNS